MDPSKLQSVWATPDAPARSIGQARRRHRSIFTNEEPPSKKAKVNRRDKNEETKQADSKKTESQSTSRALVPRFAANVSQMQLPDFAFLPTHPSPALDFHAYQTRDQYSMRYPVQGRADNEGAPSGFNEFLARLSSKKGPQSENGQTVFDMCLESLASQEGISAIDYQIQSREKLVALAIAFGLFSRQVGDGNLRFSTVNKAALYIAAELGRSSQWKRALVAWDESNKGIEVSFYDKEKETTRLLRLDTNTGEGQIIRKFQVHMVWKNDAQKKSIELPNLRVTYPGLVREVRARGSKNPGSIKKFGGLFWELVGGMMPTIPEVVDIETQVGLMYVMLMDVQLLSLQSGGEGSFNGLTWDPFTRCMLWLALASSH